MNHQGQRAGTRWPDQVAPVVAQRWLLVGVSAAALPHLFSLWSWISVCIVACVLWRGLALSGRVGLPKRGLLAAITLAAAAAVVTSSGMLLGRETGTALLAVMTGLKLLETRRNRDVMLTIFLGFLLVATYFFQQQSLWVLSYLGGTALLLVATMIALNRGLDGPRPGEVLRPAAVLLLQALPIMVVLFVMVPRLAGPLWGHMDPGTGITGLSNIMTPGSIRSLVLSDELAFRVRFEGQVPKAEQLYWRGPVLWQHEGGVWREGEVRELRPPEIASRGAASDYSVLLEANGTRWLPALDMPLRGSNPDAYRGPAGELMALRRVAGRRTYRVSSALEYQLQRVLPAATREAALQLAPGDAPRLRAMVETWQSEGAAGADLVRRALALIRDQPFRYTLEPPPLSGDPIDSFFFDTRAGYCEHFASAFAVLMRAAGIPARIVTGYLGAHQNPIAGHWLVYQADAHAWTELWLPQQGWVRVDPTAAIAPERVESNLRTRFAAGGVTANSAAAGAADWLFRLAMSWDALEERWNRWVIGYDHRTQRTLWDGLADAAALLLPAGVALSVIIALSVWVSSWRARVSSPADRAFQRFCRRLGRAGHPRSPTEGPASYARRVAAARPDLALGVQRISRLYERLTYAPEARRSHEAMRDLVQTVARFRPRPAKRP